MAQLNHAGSISAEKIDAHLEAILKAAGSSLRHYMPATKDDLRKVMSAIVSEVQSAALNSAAIRATGEDL